MAMYLYLCFAIVFPYAILSYSHFQRKESLLTRPSLRKLARSPSELRHEVVIAIQQLNLDKLEETLLDRSTPGSKLYQQWLTFDEVGSYIKNDIAVNAVTKWLSDNNVTISWKTVRSEYIMAVAPFRTWETMLNTKFYEWEDSSDLLHVQRLHLSDHYSIPLNLVDHIHAILNTVQAPPVISKHAKVHDSKKGLFRTNLRVELSEDSRSNRETIQANKVTVSFLDSYYQIASNSGSNTLSQSVFETSNEYYSPSDLTSFQNRYQLPVQAALAPFGHATTSQCSTTSTGTPSCFEGNLDIQYIMGVAQNVASIYWYVSGSNPFLTWITAVANEQNPPQANSISWGSIEQLNSASTLQSFNTEAKKLAAMGVTVLVSSGDDGVANTGCDCNPQSSTSYSNCACNADSSSTVLNTAWSGSGSWTGTGYFPSFPATCPYVTAVGATMGAGGDAPAIGEQEIACQSQLGGVITTGGGFSTYFPRPSWQDNAVNTYFSSLSGSNIPSSGYNPNGRGYPDISLVGVNYQVMIAGSLYSLYGTSCSAPVLAAMVSLLNSERQSIGLPSVGFLNPTLYSSNSTPFFNDIVSGSNSCCANPAQSTCCNAGFTATPGWDPLTGWGSIDFPKFAYIYNTSAQYIPGFDDDSPTPALSSTLVAIIIVVVVVIAVLIGVVVFIRYTCCKQAPSQQVEMPRHVGNFQPVPGVPFPGAWACPACTLHNPAAAPACSACGTYRRQM